MVVPLDDGGDYLLGGRGVFLLDNGGDTTTNDGAQMRFRVTTDYTVEITIQRTADDAGDETVDYVTDAIPTCNQAREIAIQHLQ